MISNTQITAQPEYDIQFWNAMRNKEAREDILAKGRDISTGTYSMPTVAAGKVMNEIEKESDFRKIATVIRAYKNGYKIFAKDCKDKAEFVAERAAIPVYESAGDFDEKTIEKHLDIFMNRKYRRNGAGGLFTLKFPPRDMRMVEIWYQMCWYLDEFIGGNER